MIELVEYRVKRGFDRYQVVFDIRRDVVRVYRPDGMLAGEVPLGFQSGGRAEALVDRFEIKRTNDPADPETFIETESYRHESAARDDQFPSLGIGNEESQ